MRVTLRALFFAFLISTALSSRATDYNMANGTWTICSGTFYDDGGVGAQYANNDTLTETFTSSSGLCLQFQFSFFKTQAGVDFLIIYDGPSTTSPSKTRASRFPTSPSKPTPTDTGTFWWGIVCPTEEGGAVPSLG